MRKRVQLNSQPAIANEGGPEGGSLPFVTIVMPIRNEEGYIERSLRAVLTQDYPRELTEVIVVDGMSDDGTLGVVRQTAEHYRRPDWALQIDVLENPSRIVPNGLNLALRRARGEVIIRVDGHCEISADYVRRCIKILLETGADCVGGPVITRGEGWIACGIALAQSSTFGVGGVAFRTGRSSAEYVDTLAFGAYRREVFERIGGFDEELVRNQDDEFNYRLAHAGGKILLDPSIHSLYYNRSSLAGLWRQYYQYGYWKVRVMQKHPGQMRLRHFAPPAFALFLLSGLLVMPFSTARSVWLAVVAAYSLINLVAAAKISSRSGWRYFVLLPLVFVTLHLSYGLGFLVGLLRFARRWGETRKEVLVEHRSPL
jgi:glycosyltransferase involved in cell wall biosynthesis